uniref:Uncharacterized protein AlNc14C118G6581 n=1 Tax=Albugo laibachii Nc14 TaxID=890382 RepID=F0WJ50_9STRA|nr:hypothetical protein PITG_05283 [Albugo laibachii Nc14]|eukprot:CCA21296.1 hypothetical protein PITG_05283 [Albugo laibachii Nc14]
MVAFGNKQVFGQDYNITFAAVMDVSSVNIILALARKWCVPAKHGDIPNAYVKSEKESDLSILSRIPKGMGVEQDVLHELEVSCVDEIALELKKALHVLKQARKL